MKYIYTFAFVCLFGFCLNAQPDSATFPDFTETDINGVEHTLSSYLADDKTVIIDIFTTWCSICVGSLPNLHSLEEQYGDDLVFLSFERDASTTNEAAWAVNNDVTNPIFANSLETMDTWNTNYQPNFFVICPDGSYELKNGGVGPTSTVLSGYVDACLEGSVGIYEESSRLDFSVLSNPVASELVLQSNRNQGKFEVYGLTGELYLQGTLQGYNSNINVVSLSQGIYFVKVEANGVEAVKRFVKE